MVKNLEAKMTIIGERTGYLRKLMKTKIKQNVSCIVIKIISEIMINLFFLQKKGSVVG